MSKPRVTFILRACLVVPGRNKCNEFVAAAMLELGVTEERC
jgi:hypothetical protein